MEKYEKTAFEGSTHVPAYPERTGYRATEWGYVYRVWKTTDAMVKALAAQGRKAPSSRDWRPWAGSRLDKRVSNEEKAARDLAQGFMDKFCE